MAGLVGATPDGLKSDTSFLTVRLQYFTVCDNIGNVTLRARLTAAFLGVVLGPVLLGAVFVGTTVTELAHERARDRLAAGAGAVRAEIAARCDRLESAATSAALLAADGRTLSAPVDGGLATSVVLVDATGAVRASAGPPAPAAWADCTSPRGRAADAPAIGVRVERRDRDGTLLGYAVATAPVDDALLQALTRAGGVAVRQDNRDNEASAGRVRYRLEPADGQPLHLLLGTDPAPQNRLYALLVAVVTAAALLALLAAAWLARSTTRPLTELVSAAERVSAGDLTVRVRVYGGDEVGRLGATFNRMVRDLRHYVRALRASRDQLRNHLALLGDTLSGTHDLSRILHVTLHTARSAAGARAGVVLLYDPATRMLVAQCTAGTLPGSVDLAGIRLKPGEGLLGVVADNGVPAHGRITPETDLAPCEPSAETYVAVPFAAPEPAVVLDGESTDTAWGVLALYDRLGPDEFTETDVSTLATFAAQAAVALDNVRLHEEAQRLSLTDPLTGLFNYRYLRESLRRELERAGRFGRHLAVLALDLDHFKDVNDTYGHDVGDVVLAEVARRLRSLTREVDVAFRRGGEEFVILLPETDAAGGAALASRLAGEVRQTPVYTRDHAINVTVSIGVAVFPEHGTTGSVVLEAADRALYAAKAAGRDACRTADAGGRHAADAARLVPQPASPHGAGDRGAHGAASASLPMTGASRGTQPTQRAHGG
jgi:diguanylate cyclase (GGDEF)-like protein